ncbi:coiled-coil domain-containing protein 63-like [Thunnus albacares]|uniref:coiled-coil domain-containing protein 63-like n=1 Tax=Thunnus albacares TaxID=8236 RepID=UPI001CF6A990|nr:coiled-coil domain-containing protein 63-like [Thunnus albacares]
MAAEFLEEQYNDIQEENDQYKQLISQEKENLVSLDKELTAAETRIQEKLAVPGGILKEEGKPRRHSKQIRILENKLNQDTVKFDEMLCSNMDYHKEIAHLLQQKGTVCNIEEKFNRQLATQQGIMDKLGEKSTLAFNQRSEAQTRMKELEVRDGIEADTKRKMQQKILNVHNTKLRSFMEKKSQEIIPLKEEEDSKTRKKQQQYQSGVKRLEMYMQGHSTLVEVTGEKELCQIGQSFIQNEQKNFALINYINELHNRKNMMKICTGTKKSDIMFLEQEKNTHDEQNEGQFKDLESELEKYSCLADSLENQCALVQEALDQLKTAITGLVSEIMPTAVIVTFDNIAHFTSILAQSISDLMIQANTEEDEQTGLPPQNLLLANFDLLPEGEEVVDTERGRSPALSLKSARSD